MDETLRDAQAALKSGNKAQARRILKWVLKTTPSVEGWILAAEAMDDDAQKITCLKKALELDPWHTHANRMLLKLEQPKSIIYRERPGETQETEVAKTQEVQPLPELKRKVREMEYQRRERNRRARRRFGCLMIILLQISCTFFTFGAIGVIPGFFGTIDQLFGGSKPVRAVEGTPIEEIIIAPAATVPASQSKEASNREVDILDHGYNHEYTFNVRNGDEILGYVQFMSVSAGAVSENVVLLDINDNVIDDDRCHFLGDKGLLGGQSNVSFQCIANQTGIWKVRVLGIQGESVGAYFIGVENMSR